MKEEKIKAVEQLRKFMDSYPTIGFIELSKLPTRQFQIIKKGLGENAVIKSAKKTIIKFALKDLKKENIAELEKMMPPQPGIILTKLSPFQFYKTVSQLKSFTFAKDGDVAKSDILVKAGPTDLLPGPVVSEFAKAGIPAGVEGGKIAVKKDTVAAKKGSKINKDLANILRKLKIEATEVKLNIAAIYENGKIYTKDVLNLVDEYPGMVGNAFNKALNLSIAIGYPTEENVGHLMAKACQQAKTIEKIGGAS